MQKIFDHEKLRVYQTSISFIVWLRKIMSDVPKKHAAFNQLDRASTSVPLNIAEGNGKSSPRDRCRFFDIARGSALECAAALDVLVAKGVLKENEIAEGKQILKDVVSMIVGLIKSNLPDRICESSADYGEEQDHDQD
jgi:four helix bundle protein